jgi:hypothetical protein
MDMDVIGILVISNRQPVLFKPLYFQVGYHLISEIQLHNNPRLLEQKIMVLEVRMILMLK